MPRDPAGRQPRRQRVVLVHRRGCRRLPCAETGQDRGIAKGVARTVPERQLPMPRAQEMRGKSVLRLTRWRRSRAARGARRGPLGCAYNVTDAEFACIGSGGIPHILYRRCDRDVTDATDGANRCVGYGRQAKARPMPRASIPRPELRGGNWVGLSKPYNGMNASKALSPVNRNPCIGEAFLVRKWLDPSTKLRIERIDEDVIRQQALNDGAAMLIVG